MEKKTEIKNFFFLLPSASSRRTRCPSCTSRRASGASPCFPFSRRRGRRSLRSRSRGRTKVRSPRPRGTCERRGLLFVRLLLLSTKKSRSFSCCRPTLAPRPRSRACPARFCRGAGRRRPGGCASPPPRPRATRAKGSLRAAGCRRRPRSGRLRTSTRGSCTRGRSLSSSSRPRHRSSSFASPSGCAPATAARGGAGTSPRASPSDPRPPRPPPRNKSRASSRGA